MQDTDVALQIGSTLGIVLFLAGPAFVIAGAEVFFDGLLGSAARIGLPAFVLTVVVSGFELENLAAGIATNLRGLGNAAAGTFLGGTTFLALGVAGLGATIAPIRASLATAVLVLTAAPPLPLLALAVSPRSVVRPTCLGGWWLRRPSATPRRSDGDIAQERQDVPALEAAARGSGAGRGLVAGGRGRRRQRAHRLEVGRLLPARGRGRARGSLLGTCFGAVADTGRA